VEPAPGVATGRGGGGRRGVELADDAHELRRDGPILAEDVQRIFPREPFQVFRRRAGTEAADAPREGRGDGRVAAEHVQRRPPVLAAPRVGRFGVQRRDCLDELDSDRRVRTQHVERADPVVIEVDGAALPRRRGRVERGDGAREIRRDLAVGAEHVERELARATALAGQGGVACLHLLHGHGRRRTQRVKLVVAPCWIGMSRTLCASLRRTHEMHAHSRLKHDRALARRIRPRPCVEDYLED
jgi:hypothetical protein